MKFRKLFVLALMMAIFTCFATSAQNSDKITQAVMKVYNDHLIKNPNDYNTLFMRANQLFYNNDYDAAMADVERVIQLAPSKETELLFDAYLLRGKLYEMKKDYQAAMADFDKAAEIDPKSLSWVDMKGYCAYKSGDYEVAKKQFETILQQQPRNYEAMFNLGCIAAKQGKEEEAMKWVNNAISLYPAEVKVYLNRGYVQELLGKYRDASDTYLISMGVTDDNGESINRLFTLARDHYDDVMGSLRTVIDENPRNGLFYRLSSALALNYKHYGQALRDLKVMTNNNLMEYSTIYNDEAMCLFQLGDYDQAYNYINKAIASDATNPDGYVLKSMIELRQGKGGNYKTALATLDQALALNQDYVPALLTKARMMIAQKKYKEALPFVTKAVNAESENADALMLRGWLNKNHLKNNAAAKADFEKVLTLDDSELTSLTGFALHELGRDSEATAWGEKMIKIYVPIGGEAYYYAAALQAAMGNKAQGIKYLESCLANGYGGLYDIKLNDAPYVNLAPLRTESSFNVLLNNSQFNFQER